MKAHKNSPKKVSLEELAKKIQTERNKAEKDGEVDFFAEPDNFIETPPEEKSVFDDATHTYLFQTLNGESIRNKIIAGLPKSVRTENPSMESAIDLYISRYMFNKISEIVSAKGLIDLNVNVHNHHVSTADEVLHQFVNEHSSNQSSYNFLHGAIKKIAEQEFGKQFAAITGHNMGRHQE